MGLLDLVVAVLPDPVLLLHPAVLMEDIINPHPGRIINLIPIAHDKEAAIPSVSRAIIQKLNPIQEHQNPKRGSLSLRQGSRNPRTEIARMVTAIHQGKQGMSIAIPTQRAIPISTGIQM